MDRRRELSRSARPGLGPGRGHHLAGLSTFGRLVATYKAYLPSLVDKGTALGYKSRAFVGPTLKLWSPDSLYHWLFKTYRRRKRKIPRLLSQPEHRHLALIRLKRPKETREWVERL